MEINAYPPGTLVFELLIKYWTQLCLATGKLALYRKSDFFKFIDFAVQGWANIEKDSFGPFLRKSSLGFCVEHFREVNVTRDLFISVNNNLVENCIHLDVEQLDVFNNTQEWLKDNNFSVPWLGMNRWGMTYNWAIPKFMSSRFYLNFTLLSTSINHHGLDLQPDCYHFPTSLQLDNSDHDGQVPVYLDVKPVRIQCSSPIMV